MLQMLPNMMITMNSMEFAFSIHAPSQSPAAPDAERIPNTISTLPNMLQNVLMFTSYEKRVSQPTTGTLWVTSCDLDYSSLYSMFLNTSPGYGYSSLGCILTSIVQISVRTKAIVGYTTDVFGHRSFTLTHSISPYRCREPKLPAVALLEAIELRWLHNSCSRALHTTVMDTQLRLCPIATVVVEAFHCKVLAHRLTRISKIL